MAVFYFARTSVPNGGNFDITTYYYDTSDDSIDIVGPNSSAFDPGSDEPALDEVVFSACNGADLNEYKYDGPGTFTITKVTTADSPTCCSLNTADFSISVTGDDGSTNGEVIISSSVVDVDDYEARIDGGAFIPGAGGLITFSGLAHGSHTINIRLIGGSCFGTILTNVPDIEVNLPFALAVTSPGTFLPVFYPIEYSLEFAGNGIDIIQSGGLTMIDAGSNVALGLYLLTKPKVRIYDTTDYDGVYQIDAFVDNTFVIDATFTSTQAGKICPSRKQTFELYCEEELNSFVKVADIGSAADVDGQYNIRVEGFLQGVFLVNPPVEGDEITLGRKFYLIPASFEVDSQPISTAVYSAIESLTPYLDDLVPLGPAPMNFINEQTQKGMPVLFSFLELTTGRVKNVISSKETDIISTNDVVLNALPCNSYDIEWIKIAGNINGAIVSDPALPSWIVITPDTDRLAIAIDTCAQGSGAGDYEPDDYSSTDYLTAGFNELVGCYEFEISDGDGVLFTLSICIFPIQQPASEVCQDDAFNIAWVNRQGGFSSYAFAREVGSKGLKQLGLNVGESTDFKKEGELKKSSVRDVFDSVTVHYSNRNVRELLFISSLRQSIQAYLFNDDTGAWDIPIFIDPESFPVFTLPFNQADHGNGSFTFRYSDEIRIQRQ